MALLSGEVQSARDLKHESLKRACFQFGVMCFNPGISAGQPVGCLNCCWLLGAETVALRLLRVL